MNSLVTPNGTSPSAALPVARTGQGPPVEAPLSGIDSTPGWQPGALLGDAAAPVQASSGRQANANVVTGPFVQPHLTGYFRLPFPFPPPSFPTIVASRSGLSNYRVSKCWKRDMSHCHSPFSALDVPATFGAAAAGQW